LATALSVNSSMSLPFPWQQAVWENFNHRIEQRRVPHALILNGGEGMGVERLACTMAERLLCVATHNGYACGTCKACQLLAAGTHPDLIRVEPEESGKRIKIIQIRGLCSALEKTSQQGGWKVALISPAESMNIAASNALLKSLEEPQANTLLILISHRPSLVPPTIRSRCQIETLGIPGSDMAHRWLMEVAGEHAEVSKVLEMAGGRPLLALEYLQGDGLESRQHVEALLDSVRRAEATPLDAAQACQKYDADELVEWIMNYIHRLITGELQNQRNPALFHFLDKLIKARGWILSGSTINTQLLWEELFIEWSQVFQRRN